MALKKCNECGGVLSDKAFFCPHCGLPMGDPAHFFCYPTFLLIRDFGEIKANLNEGFSIRKRYIGRDGPKVKISGEYKGQPPDYLRGRMDLLDKYFKVIGTAYFHDFSGWNKGNQRVVLHLQCEMDGKPVIYSDSALEECLYIIQCKCGKDRHYISPSREIDSTVIEDPF